MADLSIILTINGGEPRAFKLDEGGPRIVLGRAPDATIPIDSKLLSRKHCEFKLGAKGLEVRDLGSANGTHVNGKLVQASKVEPGDLVRCGDVVIRVEYDAGEWIRDAAAAGELRCQKCKKLISMATVGDGQSLEWGEQVLCPTCHESASLGDRGAAYAALAQTLQIDGYMVVRPVSPDTAFMPVFRARRIGLEDVVAIKALILVPGLSEKKIERFTNEGRAMARIKHPNVVQVYDVRQNDRLVYIVMEFVEGETLLRRIERETKLSPSEACRIGIAMAGALQAAHDQGIVHRNVKPSNILIAREDGAPKLIDFGLAKGVKAFGPGVTGEEETLGTIRYMAPEQVKDARAADARSDLYSLAATVFHAITGRIPYPDRTDLDLLQRAVAGSLPSFDPTTVEAVPPPIAAVLARTLRKNPAERPQTAAEFRDLLQKADIEVEGRTPSDPERTTKLPKGTPNPGLMSGEFAGSQLHELVQMLGVNQKTGILSVRSAGGNGDLLFKSGRIVAARTKADLTCEEAAYKVLALESGNFEFRPGFPPGLEVPEGFAVEALLLEALRRRDENAAR